VVPGSILDLMVQTESSSCAIKHSPGEIGWVPAGLTHTLTNKSSKPAQFVTLEFKPEQQKQ
jgi:oxalate decarboxylase/phosphoglucose isomerase-like protein (cupin superfamily)